MALVSAGVASAGVYVAVEVMVKVFRLGRKLDVVVSAWTWGFGKEGPVWG